MTHERASLPTPESTKSFWHSEPNEFLLGHRTTPEIPAEADIVIIGSGITGTSVARYLVEDERAKGKSIVMLEAREACWGATGRVRKAMPYTCTHQSWYIVLSGCFRMEATASRYSSTAPPKLVLSS
jgi:choline dehydrogenase-like flavoprotein